MVASWQAGRLGHRPQAPSPPRAHHHCVIHRLNHHDSVSCCDCQHLPTYMFSSETKYPRQSHRYRQSFEVPHSYPINWNGAKISTKTWPLFHVVECSAASSLIGPTR